MDADLALRAVGVLLAVIALLFGLGKAWGTLMGEVRAGNAATASVAKLQAGTDRKLDALHRRFGELENVVTQARLDHAALSGRVDTWERMQGLSPVPMYRRTQPIRPVEGPQDVFRPEDTEG